MEAPSPSTGSGEEEVIDMEATSSGEVSPADGHEILRLLITDFLSPLKTIATTPKQQQQQSHLAASAKILLTIVRNALRSHQLEKFRKVRLSNPKIHKTVVTVPYAVDLLTAVGFVHAEIDAENYLVFNETDLSTSNANLFCSAMDEELNSMQQNVAQSNSAGNHIASRSTTIAASGGSGNSQGKSSGSGETFLSDEERKRRAQKAKQERLAKKAEKERAMRQWKEDQADRHFRQNKIRKFETVIADHPRSPGVARLSPAASDQAPESLESLRAKAAKAWNLKQQQQQHPSYDINHGVDSDTLAMSDKEKDIEIAVSASLMDTVGIEPSKMDAIPAEEGLSDSKNAVVLDSISPPAIAWKERLESLPRCGPATGIRKTSVFNQKDSRGQTNTSSTRTCLKRLFSEFQDLQTSLPSDKLCSAWLLFDEETPQYLRAVLTAPLPGPSPYAGGVFAFDIYVPDDYPNISPMVQIVTTGRGTVRFGPNLYQCGKVCLSLLGTWEGPKWNPKKSSLFQVLVSIQGLILGAEHPYYLEPGHGGWEKKIKEGDFTVVGNTLSGKVIREELRLPPEVWAYEDELRVASLRYAIMEPLALVAAASSQSQNSSKFSQNEANLAHLLPFREILHFHFSQNAHAIMESVGGWINAPRPFSTANTNYRNPFAASSSAGLEDLEEPYPTKYVNSLRSMYHQLESNLKTVSKMEAPPPVVPTTTSKAYEMKSPTSLVSASVPVANDSTTVDKKSTLRQRMKEAATSGDYMLAGKIQNEIQEIQELELWQQKIASLTAQMKEAASREDYVTAGSLQNQVTILQNQKQAPTPASSTPLGGQLSKAASIGEFGGAPPQSMNWFGAPPSGNPPPQLPSNQPGGPPFGAPLSGVPPGLPFGTLPSHPGNMWMHKINASLKNQASNEGNDWDDGYNENNWDDGYDSDDSVDEYPPNGYYTGYKTRNWGVGHKLNEFVSPPSKAPSQQAKQSEMSPVPRLAVKDARHLRIRLPTSSIVEELFDGSEKLKTVYQVVQHHLAIANVDVGQHTTDVRGAFAAPLSEFGFTLLLTHPKREYSLEMDGSKSLTDLDMAKFATLTVMKCNERGVAKRADLEDKLAEARGDAMDLDDLNYEALQELSEKIGKVAPGDEAWKGLEQSALKKFTTLLSPMDFLSQKKAADDDGNGSSRCCICLGEFDPEESNPSLRLMNCCGHIMHASCLESWLLTNTSCPICKQSFCE